MVRALLVLTAATLLSGSADAYEFTRVARLEPAVAFWQRVYATWSVDEIALHDTEDFRLVYRVVKVPPKGETLNGLSRKETVQRAMDETRAALARLDKARPSSSAGLTGLDRELFERLASVDRADKFAFGGRVRAQNGLRERFIAGYTGAGAWEPEVRARLVAAGLPEDLVALAYVESLMLIRAHSHAGALGIWQFMPATGREYMSVNHVVDERMDPILATDAAARYINTALENVGPWPVAITSYNYGRGGMKRAIEAVGSNDLGTILERYQHGRFGFAARNYYASFLAVDGVLKNVERFFPGVKQRARWRYDVVRLPFPVLAPQLVSSGAVAKDTLAYMNPALTERARSGQEVLPRGLPLRVPQGTGGAFTSTVLAFSNTERQQAEAHVRTVHVANGKETVKAIAKKYGVSVDTVAAAAGVTAKDRVKKGTRLAIPSVAVRYSVFPSAREIDIPDAPALPAELRIAKAPLPLAPLPTTVSERSARAEPAPKGRVKVLKVSKAPVVDDGALAVDVITSARVEGPGPVDILTGVMPLPAPAHDDDATAQVPDLEPTS